MHVGGGVPPEGSEIIELQWKLDAYYEVYQLTYIYTIKFI